MDQKNEIDDPLVTIPIPEQAPAVDGLATIRDTQLWYWDTGGTGTPVVLVHPASGSGLIWGHQQPILVEAGYRVIGYSRRGYYGSAPCVPGSEGVGAEDLHQLVEFLAADRFHLVASAAGGTVATDYALINPEKVLSLTVSSNPAGIRQGYIADAIANMRPPGYGELPRWFREIGPSYRAANPEGVKDWIALEQKGAAPVGVRQKVINTITDETLGSLQMPVLLISGGADNLAPPGLMRMVARHIRKCSLAVVSEAGHSVYWERPDVFNRAVCDFLADQ